MSGRHASGASEVPDASGTAPAPTSSGRDFIHRAIMIGSVLVAAVLIYLGASAYIPRWWSQRIGHAVDGELFTGALLGFCFGCVFTIVPLGLLWVTMRRPMRWKLRLFWLALATVLAAPNLMTLGVAVGSGSGAHAGQRTMDVKAPMFRGATATGATFALLVFVVLLIVYRRRGGASQPPTAPGTPGTPAGPPSETPV